MKKELNDLLTAFEAVVADKNSDAAIAFIEDLSDSFTPAAPTVDPEMDNRIHELEGEVESWKNRYRDRFYGRVDETERNEYTETKDERPDGDSIKIKDIFSRKEN